LEVGNFIFAALSAICGIVSAWVAISQHRARKSPSKNREAEKRYSIPKGNGSGHPLFRAWARDDTIFTTVAVVLYLSAFGMVASVDHTSGNDDNKWWIMTVPAAFGLFVSTMAVWEVLAGKHDYSEGMPGWGRVSVFGVSLVVAVVSLLLVI
jgi:hypothetical protein